jgi:TorA specific chaperone
MTHAAHVAELWRWLAGVFAAPMDTETLQACRLAVDDFAAAPVDPLLQPALERLRDALAALPPGAAGVAALAHSHTLLFSGVAGRNNTVAPYESAFTTSTGRLFGESESRMTALLADLDLRVADDLREPADHVSVEAAVMAELAEAHDLNEPRLELQNALRGWIGAFRDACVKQDARGFYAGAAMLAAALADLEMPADVPVDGATAIAHA